MTIQDKSIKRIPLVINLFSVWRWWEYKYWAKVFTCSNSKYWSKNILVNVSVLNSDFLSSHLPAVPTYSIDPTAVPSNRPSFEPSLRRQSDCLVIFRLFQLTALIWLLFPAIGQVFNQVLDDKRVIAQLIRHTPVNVSVLNPDFPSSHFSSCSIVQHWFNCSS